MFGEAQLFFLPSVAEALPVALMEAQAAGLPVVATNVGSVSQAMVDGQSGFMVASKDVKAMCDKLEFLIRNPCQWPVMGQVGRAYIAEHYDIKVLNQRLVHLMTGILKS